MTRPTIPLMLAGAVLVATIPVPSNALTAETEIAAYSGHASGIEPFDSRPSIAPARLVPPVPSADPPRAYLLVARSAIGRDRTAEAQEALERAETRLLDHARTNASDDQRAVLDIAVARRFVAARDRLGALRAIDDALAADTAAAPVSVPPAAFFPPPVLLPVPTAPVATYALLPGHWQLRGATYHWVPPETTLRHVAGRQLVPGEYAWRDGAWMWVPRHYDQ